MNNKAKKALVFGVFDGLHAGHLFFLNKAKELVDELVIVVAPDSVVLKIKNRTPQNDLQSRVREMKKNGLAKKVIVGDSEQGSWKVLSENKPDIVILGYDQKELRADLEAARPSFSFYFDIVIIDSHRPDELHSSQLNGKT